MLLKVNPGTQIRVSPPLSRNKEQSHYLIDPPPQKRVIKFMKFYFFGEIWEKNPKIWNFQIFKIFYTFLGIEWYGEIRYLITSFQSY